MPIIYKAVDSEQLNSNLTDIANAIRAKGGTSEPLTFPDEFISAIQDIPTGGDITVERLDLTANGTYTAPSGKAYSPVTVNVPTPAPSLQSKTVTPSENTQNVAPDSGYDGLSGVQVNPIPSQYIVPTGTKQITENGTYDVTGYASAEVNVSGGTAITDGIVITARDTNGFATNVTFFGTIVNQKQFYNRTSGDGAWINVTSVVFHDTVTAIGDYAFNGCGNLSDLDFSNVRTIGGNAFNTCGFTFVNLPQLTAISSGAFISCSSLQSFSAPLLTNANNRQVLRSCTALQTAIIGSIGHGVTSISNAFFENDTQSGLTITIYTIGSYADTAVANTRYGATNATIIIKASEATTYNGTSYAAGDTILTSIP